MTREEFIEILRKKRYSYKMEGDKIVITHGWWVDLDGLETLPPGVAFKNRGHVLLSSLETLPPGVQFKNGGYVGLSRLKSISPGVHFKNDGYVYLKGLGWVENNEGIGIEGVDNKRLLHLMIKKELFI